MPILPRNINLHTILPLRNTEAAAPTDAVNGEPSTGTQTSPDTEVLPPDPCHPISAQTVEDTRARVAANGMAAQIHFGQIESAAPISTAQALTSTAILRIGDEGPAVTEMQAQLNARGANLALDGDFGPKTLQALKDFQLQSGIHPDGIVGPDTRAAFSRTADGGIGITAESPLKPTTLSLGASGPEVADFQNKLNQATQSGMVATGEFGSQTQQELIGFQRRAGIAADGVVGPNTLKALDDVIAGNLALSDVSKSLVSEGNVFHVHNLTRQEIGTRSVPDNRIIALDSNSASGEEEVLRPLIIIPNNATPVERQAAQEAVDQVAAWLNENAPHDDFERQTTGLVKTTSENGGRGVPGFFHTEMHSVNDTAATELIKSNPEAYAEILSKTLGKIPGANFIVPHGRPNSRNIIDPGAVSKDGSTTEKGLGQLVIREGFMKLHA